MDALILAAGFGSRLREVESCKPLTDIHGLSLIEISIRQLVAAGASRIVVATGHQGAVVEANLTEISERLAVPIITRRVPDFSKPNGHSILAAADVLSERFLLVMSDHILSDELLAALTKVDVPDDGVVLATDTNIECERVDPEDATWVRLSGSGAIIQIGKHLESYDAVDCGAFLATRGLLDAIEDAIGDGKSGSLSDGMQRLADGGKAYSCDIGSAWWIDVDERHSLQLAKEQVKAHLPNVFSQANAKNAISAGLAQVS